jgi:hypothetical protein
MSTTPTTTCCQNGWMPTITNPFCSVAGMNTPMTLPRMDPYPPNRLVPPMTTPAITLRLVAVCPPIVVDWKNARLSQPAKPASSPDRA